MNASLTTQYDTLPVIDAHSHIFPDSVAEKAKISVGDFYNLPMFTAGTLTELYKVRSGRLENRKITLQAIFSPAMNASQTKNINSFISTLCEKDKSLIGFGTLHKENNDYKDEIQRIKALGLKGIKFHSDFQKTDIDDEKMLPVYKEAAKNNLPVIFHMGDKKLKYSSVEKLKNVLCELSELAVIAAHMGGYMHWQEAYNTLAPDDRLYFDVSSALSFIPHYEFNEMLEKFGVSHFFFGSDFPMWNPLDELKKLSEFVPNDIDRRKIEYHNYIAFLKKYSNERKSV